ncbi:MAG: hypothetical protein AAF368_09030, partial [Planctomycetota bacterium]
MTSLRTPAAALVAIALFSLAGCNLVGGLLKDVQGIANVSGGLVFDTIPQLLDTQAVTSNADGQLTYSLLGDDQERHLSLTGFAPPPHSLRLTDKHTPSQAIWAYYSRDPNFDSDAPIGSEPMYWVQTFKPQYTSGGLETDEVPADGNWTEALAILISAIDDKTEKLIAKRFEVFVYRSSLQAIQLEQVDETRAAIRELAEIESQEEDRELIALLSTAIKQKATTSTESLATRVEALQGELLKLEEARDHAIQRYEDLLASTTNLRIVQLDGRSARNLNATSNAANATRAASRSGNRSGFAVMSGLRTGRLVFGPDPMTLSPAIIDRYEINASRRSRSTEPNIPTYFSQIEEVTYVIAAEAEATARSAVSLSTNDLLKASPADLRALEIVIESDLERASALAFRGNFSRPVSGWQSQADFASSAVSGSNSNSDSNWITVVMVTTTIAKL